VRIDADRPIRPPPTTYPYIRSAAAGRVGGATKPVPVASLLADQLFYLQSAGIGFEAAVSMMVSGLF